ncbi:MAG: ATP-dependent DNA helicase [Gammaproteobacteria bacterium]|nr:ATP-dependent DNA helicase [Gammaproteobacteria bacterium]MCP5425517.1 ATP-dependent DNA helicase [Gammaproteobacteria bacterium]MCP5459363.1 ATP-dependent DNA helicase [Gammaproteobacteria bacterium]
MQAAALLGFDGPLARHLPGFAPRWPQQRMAQAVADTLASDGTLLAEAGTGTGKTYAYLAPALLRGGRVVISTGTRNLQDQLFNKDLPVVCQALGLTPRLAMLKGRSNYLCLQRLERLLGNARLSSPGQATELAHISAWARVTQSGDIAEVDALPEDAPLWFQVTSTTDNCLGQECPHWSSCHVVKARRKALDADVLVVNHHLFFADRLIKEEGFGELLPDADAFIVDEAHQLPEIASHFFGLALSSRQLTALAQDTVAEQLRDAPDFTDLKECAQHLELAVTDARLALGPELRRAPWSAVSDAPTLIEARQRLRAALESLQTALEPAAVRGKGLDHCHKRCQTLLERWGLLTEHVAEQKDIAWFETHSRSFTLHLTPLDIAPHFRAHRAAYPGAWIFTSATLAVGDSFQHFAQRLGLDAPSTLRLDSPFDFAHNALLYHPPGLPDPASPAYIDALVDAALPVLEASQARAFLLFTSYRALHAAFARLEGRLPYPLLLQGSLPKNELLTRFRELGHAVLLGTASFWEGVDVRGDALSCVIIDKLPFAAPNDPLVRGRIDAIKRRGGDPFLEYQVPQAVIALKQGAGRLIRDVSDRGVLMLCDPRLLSRSYGQLFLNSLPPMRRTRQLAQVRDFFARSESTEALTQPDMP